MKKVSGNFGYMRRSNPWGDLDQMWRVGRYGGRNHVCNIWWLSVKGCGCGETAEVCILLLTWRVALTTPVTLPCEWPCDGNFDDVRVCTRHFIGISMGWLASSHGLLVD